ncbi:stage V sporulation protein AB [Clostridiaceae bacterium M8S5]|nr:stage V sporulation protein AB [Clostridiaceae bacterium M8S5]
MKVLMVLMALSIGIIEGTGLAAFITLLDIIPRLAQLTKTNDKVGIYEKTIGISIGVVILARAIYIDLGLGRLILIPISFVLGIFIGLLASALAETLDVIPVMESKLKLGKYLVVTVIALAIGKVAGSFFYWLILMDVPK